MYWLDATDREDVKRRACRSSCSMRAIRKKKEERKGEMLSVRVPAWLRVLQRLTLPFSILHLLTATAVAQQQCIALGGSTTCPAFNGSRITTSINDIFPFLSNVTDIRTFDSQLTRYVSTSYAQQKYQSPSFFGCSNVDLSNTTDLYARYTYSFICNAIVQNSLEACRTTAEANPPLCADSCSEFALSEETILASPDLCGQTGPNAIPQLRADFTNCAQPQNSLNNTCIPGYQNEPDNCGFQNNLIGLCSYCNASSINSTDLCCVGSRADQRCSNVHLPSYSSMQPLFSTTASSMPSPTSSGAAAVTNSHGLSGGQIAGIVIGSVAGAGILLAFTVCFCLAMRRRRSDVATTSLNRPAPANTRVKSSHEDNFAAAPGARVTRMAAIEDDRNDPPDGRTPQQTLGHGHAGLITSAASRTVNPGEREKSSSEDLEGSLPETQGYSSGDGGTTGQSEQLDSFKDYYSNDEIHLGDMVSTLWAYAPRANDEFELERGDMLRIVGIWDDGWATGVRVNQRADQWEPERNTQRDSGVSGGTAHEPPLRNGDVKAFPLVCVCLPQHWRKTIEGDVTEPDTSDGTATD